jgi:type II secretory pathway predicted ATPase ExeA
MLSDAMDYFGLGRELDQAGYFDTEHHRYLVKEIMTAIKKGRVIVLTGIVGCGKTKLLQQIRKTLLQDQTVAVARSLAVDKARVNHDVLMRALCYQLATDDQARQFPKAPEDRELRVVELIRQRARPAVLFVDDGHDLPGTTLASLKRLIETVREEGEVLSVALAGHPRLKNELRRPTLEEIGARTVIFTLEGIQGRQREYIEWLLTQCAASKTKPEALVAEEAMEMLAERLATPLQIEHYLTLAMEEAFHLGQKPVSVEMVSRVLATTLNDPEPHLIRHGYNVKSLAQLVNAKPGEIRAFLYGQLPPGRTQELKDQLLLAGVPL